MTTRPPPKDLRVQAAEWAVLEAARAWWVAQRPERWSEDEHLADPAVNAGGLTHDSPRPQLARAVALLVKTRK